MSVVDELHAAHKERLARLGAIRPGTGYAPPEHSPPAAPRPPAETVVYESVPSDVVNAIDTVEEWVKRQRERFEGIPVISTGPSIRHIQSVVGKYYGASINDLLGKRRKADVVFPRAVAMHIARRLTTRSYPEIGRQFGGKDHTTVLHADRKITRMAAADPSLHATIEMLIEQIGGEPK